jgi:hypothetical protein
MLDILYNAAMGKCSGYEQAFRYHACSLAQGPRTKETIGAKKMAKNQEQDQDQKSFLYVYRGLFLLAAACIVVLTIALAYFVYCVLKFFVGLIRMIITRCFAKCLQICTDILGDYLFWTLYVYIDRTL